MSGFLDIMIYEGGSGGEFNIKANDLETVSGLTNQVYLALFGGNVEEESDERIEENEQRFDYWANNFIEDEQQYNSVFEKTLRNTVLNSAGINKLENAARQDLSYLTEYADITITGSIIGLRRFELLVELNEPNNISSKIKFIWDATRKELIETIIL